MSTNLKMTRGDTKVVQVTTTSTLTASGLTGYSFWFTAKNAFADVDTAAVIRKQTVDFTVVQVGNATTPGIVKCTINPSETSGLTDDVTVLVYDVQFEDSSGNVTTVAAGTLTISADVTKTVV